MFLDLSKGQVVEYVKSLGFPAFRGEQVFDGMIQGKTLDEISNIPKDLKEKIKTEYPHFEIVRKLESKDGTIKYVFKLFDGEIVECVFMKYKYGNTLCVSTQVGCRMGCKFCASGLHGLKRNLSAGEILSEVILANRDNGGNKKTRAVTNIVLMGSGEPLDNYDNVTKFFKLVSDENSLNVSERNISLSTCGIVPNIKKLADDDFQVTLTISLHAPNDEIRKKTMPIANRYSIAEIIDACKYYFNKTHRRIIFEYTLIKDVNDSDKCAEELAERLKGFPAHVNIIPLNYVKERNLKSPSSKDAYVFLGKLEKLGLSATVRRTLGSDIGGACGQLRNSILEGKAWLD